MALAVFGGWVIWLATRIDKPVYFPVSLSIGQIHSQEFRINRSGPYGITVEAKKRIPFDTLNCLLGVSTTSGTGKCDVQAVIRADWTVTSNGNVMALGNSDGDKGGGWGNDTIERQIGSFDGHSGRHYVLHVNFTSDGSALSATDPHLVVEISPDFYEGDAWMSAYIFFICSALVIIGALMLAASAVRTRRSKRKQQPFAT